MKFSRWVLGLQLSNYTYRVGLSMEAKHMQADTFDVRQSDLIFQEVDENFKKMLIYGRK